MTTKLNYSAAAILMLIALPVLSADDDDNWVRIKLDERFRSEGVAAADVNNDGAPDVIAGDVWYEAPRAGSKQHNDGMAWKIHEIRMPGEFFAGVGYSNSFANFAHDINGDGLQDVVLIGFPGDPYHWYHRLMRWNASMSTATGNWIMSLEVGFSLTTAAILVNMIRS